MFAYDGGEAIEAVERVNMERLNSTPALVWNKVSWVRLFQALKMLNGCLLYEWLTSASEVNLCDYNYNADIVITQLNQILTIFYLYNHFT